MSEAERMNADTPVDELTEDAARAELAQLAKALTLHLGVGVGLRH